MKTTDQLKNEISAISAEITETLKTTTLKSAINWATLQNKRADLITELKSITQ